MRRLLITLAIILTACEEPRQDLDARPDITSIKNYRLQSTIDEYRADATDCFFLEHHTTDVEACTFDDTLAHQDYQVWLYFIRGALGRIEARPAGPVFPNDVSRLVYFMKERYGEAQQEFGFVNWRGPQTWLSTRTRPPSMAVVTLQHQALAAEIDAQRTETAADDL